MLVDRVTQLWHHVASIPGSKFWEKSAKGAYKVIAKRCTGCWNTNYYISRHSMYGIFYLHLVNRMVNVDKYSMQWVFGIVSPAKKNVVFSSRFSGSMWGMWWFWGVLSALFSIHSAEAPSIVSCCQHLCWWAAELFAAKWIQKQLESCWKWGKKYLYEQPPLFGKERNSLWMETCFFQIHLAYGNEVGGNWKTRY